MRRRLGGRRSPVSQLFGNGVRRYADSVLIAAADQDTCEADLELSPFTALKGRGDATPSPIGCSAARKGSKTQSRRCVDAGQPAVFCSVADPCRKSARQGESRLG